MIRAYYKDDSVAIYHGDCFDVIRDLIVDEPFAAVITDPPYASGARTEASKARREKGMGRGARFATPLENDCMTTSGFVWTMREIAQLLRPMLMHGGSFLSFIDWRQWPNLTGALESANLRICKMVVWDKQSMGLGHGFRSQHELVCHASRGVPRVSNRGVPDVLSFVRPPEDIGHEAAKPVELLQELLRVVSAKGETVIDPFMGIGSTLIAAKNLGRKAIGIELKESYCERAAERLSQDALIVGEDNDAIVRQPELFAI